MRDGVRLKNTVANQEEIAPVTARRFAGGINVEMKAVPMAPPLKEGKVRGARVTLLNANDISLAIILEKVAQLGASFANDTANEATSIPRSDSGRARPPLPFPSFTYVRRWPLRRRGGDDVFGGRGKGTEGGGSALEVKSLVCGLPGAADEA